MRTCASAHARALARARLITSADAFAQHYTNMTLWNLLRLQTLLQQDWAPLRTSPSKLCWLGHSPSKLCWLGHSPSRLCWLGHSPSRLCWLGHSPSRLCWLGQAQPLQTVPSSPTHSQCPTHYTNRRALGLQAIGPPPSMAPPPAAPPQQEWPPQPVQPIAAQPEPPQPVQTQPALPATAPQPDPFDAATLPPGWVSQASH